MKNAIKYTLSLAIAVLFFWLAFKDFSAEDYSRLWATLKNINLNWILLTLVVQVLSNVIRAWRWGILLTTVKPHMKLSNLFNATMIGYAVNMVLPRVGEVTKAINLAKYEEIDAKRVLASVVIERILDTLVFATLLAMSGFIFRSRISEVFGEVTLFGLKVSFEMGSYLILLMSIVLLIFFAAISLYPRQISKLVEVLTEKVAKSWAKKLSGAVEAFIEGAGALRHPAKYLEIMLSSFVIWFIYLLATLMPFYSMGLDKKYGLGIWEAMATMSISAFGQLITPAGAGTYQYVCQTVLNRLFNVALTEASAFALLTFFIVLFTFGLFGVGCFAWQSYNGRDQQRLGKSIQESQSVI
ncbi:MAG: flippase-like domain-containing protein [Chlorobiales bacterium]|nr:flippase-like domain-containing protein [Chlorobiales bacterium]